MYFMKTFSLFSLLLSILTLGACGLSQENTPQEDAKLSIVTTFYPIAFFTEALAGGRAEITVLTPAGTEPHDYEPSATQVAMMESADLVIAQGVGLEPWITDFKKNLNEAGVSIFEVTSKMDLLPIEEAHEEEDHHHGEWDPHTWLDPILTVQMVENIRDELIALDPEGTDLYMENSEDLKGSLLSINEEFLTGLSSCSLDTFLTAHEAFNYLAKRYKLQVLSVAGISPEEEVSARALADLVETVKDLELDTIYFESLANPKTAEVLSTEVGLTPLVLHTVEGLTEEQTASDEDYFSLMRENLEQLRTGLHCK